jgi:hypothetical protein
MAKKVHFVAIIACLVGSTVFILHNRYPLNAADIIQPGDFLSACLEQGTDTSGSDIRLRPYYHIAHTPREGGRCYFHFPPAQVRCLNPRQAQLLGFNTAVSYSGPHGTQCYFTDTQKYERLINLLKQRPPISRAIYGARVFRTWEEIRDYFAQAP